MSLFNKIRQLRKDPLHYLFSLLYILRSFLYVKKHDLIIIDDVFPHPISSFRNAEFNFYLRNIKKIRIFSAGSNIKEAFQDKRSIYELMWKYQRTDFLKGKVSRLNPFYQIKSRLAYCLFLHNAYHSLEIFEKYNIPFCFTLYPGGSFMPDNPLSDERLKVVFGSPLFRKVIVTQKNTYDYLIQKEFCKEEDILFIFGCVLPVANESINLEKKNKNGIDLIFVANKYTEGGVDKGFDLFADLASHYKNNNSLRFHIVGAWSEKDYNGIIGSNLTFYGPLPKQELHKLYSQMDLIVSPNRNNVLGQGAFDGFPTASCVEASLYGVLMMVSDPLKLNQYYKHNEEIIIIEPELHSLISATEELLRNPDLITAKGRKGAAQSKCLFSDEVQLEQRLHFLKQLIYDQR